MNGTPLGPCNESTTYLLYPRKIRGIDHASHLGPKDVIRECSITQFIQVRNWFHQLHTVLLGLESFIDLENRYDRLLLPEIFRRRNTLDLSIHCIFE